MRRPILAAVLALGAFVSTASAQVPPYLTSWGSFGTGDSQFYTPIGLAVDSDGIVYVVDSNLRRLKRFTSAGAFVSQWSIDIPTGGVAVGADGYVYLTTQFAVIEKYTKTGTLIAAWDGGYSGLTSMAADADGSLLVSSSEGVLRRYSSSGALLAEWADWLVPGFPSLESLDCVAVDGRGHFYTVQNYGQIRKFTATGTQVAQWTMPNVYPYPVRLATSPDGSLVYVEDYRNCSILVFTNTGTYLGQWGTSGTGPGQFLSPIGIAVDRLGNVFVADTNNSRVQVFGYKATPTQSISWGALKRRYR